jgi:hypothetical protein
MDDDLLGGPSPSAAAAVPFDDDLLGGGGAPSQSAAFDDDLLFGGGPPSPKPTSHSHAGPSSQGSEKLTAEALGPKSAFKIKPVKEVAQSLVGLVDANTYFLRFLYNILEDGSRVKVIVRITQTTVDLLTDGGTPEVWRSVPADQVIGVVTQTVVVAKMIGKDLETQAVVQTTDGKDMQLGFPKENGSEAAIIDFTNVLTAVCASRGLMLSVCTLTAHETLSEHIHRVFVDPRIRRQLCESLAYRTELANELAALTKEDSKIETAIIEIKGSNTGHEVMDIVTEIQQLEMLIASYTHKGDEVRGMVEDSKRQLRAVQDALKLEELRRQSAIENAVQDSQKQRLLKQVADFEIAKAMHRRELDRIAAVTAVYERRNKDRTKDVYSAGEIALRVSDLEEQLDDITRRLAVKGEDHARRVKSLAENRRRKAQAEEIIAQLKADIKAIETAKINEDLSDHLRSLEVPDLSPVVPTGTIEPPSQRSAQQAAPSSAAAASARPPISLSDDDFDGPAVAVPAPPAPKPAVSLDDDDI